MASNLLCVITADKFFLHQLNLKLTWKLTLVKTLLFVPSAPSPSLPFIICRGIWECIPGRSLSVVLCAQRHFLNVIHWSFTWMSTQERDLLAVLSVPSHSHLLETYESTQKFTVKVRFRMYVVYLVWLSSMIRVANRFVEIKFRICSNQLIRIVDF